jgi:hypothetical protein
VNLASANTKHSIKQSHFSEEINKLNIVHNYCVILIAI